MHPFKLINKLFKTNLKTKKELQDEYESLQLSYNILRQANTKLEEDITEYSQSVSEINSQLKEKEEELENIREEMVAHSNVDNDVSKVIFEVSVDEEEELVVIPKTQYNNEITSSLVSNGYISLQDSHDDFSVHVAMVLCAYDACDTIVNNFKGEE